MNKTSLLLRNKQKGLAPVLIILLIAALSIGGYLIYRNVGCNLYGGCISVDERGVFPTSFSKQTPLATPASSAPTDASPAPNGAGETANPDSIGANWKTYKNEKYKYSIKYPPTFKFQEYSWGSADFYAIAEEKLPERPELPNYYGRQLTIDYYGNDISKEVQRFSNHPLKEINFDKARGTQVADYKFFYYLAPSSKNDPVLRFMYQPEGDTMTPESEEEIREKIKIYNLMIRTLEFSCESCI